MNILILGQGGREHVLAATYSKNKKVKKVFIAPGNGLMDYKDKKIVIAPHVKSTDFDSILKLIKKHSIDLVDVAQDDPIALGFVDRLKDKGITVFGPTKNASEIEWNKAWAREFMKKYKLPIPQYKEFNNKQKGYDYIQKSPEQTVFVKASGLAGGKGAIKAETKEDAYMAIDKMSEFGKSGETFLIEECLLGEEFSLFALCDEKEYIILGAAQDHKTLNNADEGLNTGGMGCISPTSAVNKKVLGEVEKKILKPFMIGMQKEGRAYSGILYLGGMLTKNGVKIIEFNARWGDPEAEVIIPGIKTDYLSLIRACLKHKLHSINIEFDNEIRISVAISAKGYPQDMTYVKGKKVFGIDEALKQSDVVLFGAGIKRNGRRFYVDAGRVVHVVGQGKTIVETRKNVYAACSTLFIEENNLHYRTDIGWHEQERFYKHIDKNTVI